MTTLLAPPLKKKKGSAARLPQVVSAAEVAPAGFSSCGQFALFTMTEQVQKVIFPLQHYAALLASAALRSTEN